jgi:nitroreductase
VSWRASFNLDLAMTHPVLAAITERRSAKAAMMEGAPPDRTIIEAIVTAGAAAPDHGLLVPFRFVEIAPERRAALADAFEAVLRQSQAAPTPDDISRSRDKALHGPLLLALIGRFSSDHPKITETDQWLAAGGALQNMVLAAESFGLGVALRSGKALNAAPMRAAFNLVPHEELLCFLAVGKVSKRQPERPKPALSAVFSAF